MDAGAHGPMFRCMVKFRTWYELLAGEVKDVMKDEDVIKSDETSSQRTTTVEMEASALHYVGV